MMIYRYCQNDIIIAVHSALMQRISSLPNASQICFLDSSGNMDRFNCRVFLLMIDTVVGGLPVGVRKPSQIAASAFELPRKRTKKPDTLSDCVTANISSATYSHCRR